VLCFYKRPITPSKISGLLAKSNLTCVLILYINIPNLNWIDAVFQKLLSGRTNTRTNAQTGVTLNAPPPFFEWQGHKKVNTFYLTICSNNTQHKSRNNSRSIHFGINSRLFYGRHLWPAEKKVAIYFKSKFFY